MHRTLAAILALAALIASATAQTSPLPGVLLQAVAATQAAKAPYAFDLDLLSEEQTWRARFDPSANPGLRLVEPSLETLARDQRRAFERMAAQMEGVSWCASEQMRRVAQVRLVREDAETATYSFQPTRESVRGEQARQFADRLRGEFVITKAQPDLTRVRLYAPEAFNPMPLVRLDRLNINVACAPAPNGRRYASETTSEIRGSAFGQDFDERSVQRARNLHAPS